MAQKWINRISAHEWQVVSLFFSGVIIYRLGMTAFFPILFLPVGFAIGMLFEFLTRDAWNYAPEVYRSPCTINLGKGIKKNRLNLILGLGWLSNSFLMIPLGFHLEDAGLPWYLAYAFAGLIVGNTLEQIFLWSVLWTYNPKNWIVTCLTKKPVMFLKIPVSVRVGYAGVGLLCYGLYVWLIR